MKKTLTYLLLPLSTAAIAQQTPKNLVVIMADQWRGSALGFLGEEAVRTPHIDRFSQRSVVVEQCVSGYPVSSPARAMFLTGAYPQVNGVTGNCNSLTAPHDVELRQEVQTWSDVLNTQGYAMGYIGKWHLDKPFQPYINTSNNKGVAWNEWCPPERRHGFDYWVAYGTYDKHNRPMYWDNPRDRDDWDYKDQWGPEFEADRAIGFIRDNASRPFALMVSMNPPHPAYGNVPQRYKDIYRDLNTDSIICSRANVSDTAYFRRSLRNYYACMTGVDEQFGRILSQLEQMGLLENTIVVFTSDHGDSMGTHGHIGKNIYYEEAVRVPMLIGGAGLSPRRDRELLMSLEDFSPTILSLMGYGTLMPHTVATRDLSQQIKGSRKNMPTGQLYMRMWSLDTKETADWRGWRNTRYTYAARIQKGNIIEELLFDRADDPFQLTDIAANKKSVTASMRKALMQRLEEIADPLLISRN